MPTFEYEGRNLEGKRIRGSRLAQSAIMLGAQLTKEGLTPVSIVLQSEKKDILTQLKKFLGIKPVSVEEMGVFSRQMYTLLKSGVTITLALRQLAENARSLRMSQGLNGIVERLETGRDIASAMQDYPDLFSPVMLSMVRVGENTGHLDESFLRLNQYLELESSALKKAKTALRYPAFILISVILAFFTVAGWVIPTFARVFSQANVQLPMLTKVLIQISDFFLAYWFLLLPLIVISIAGFIYWLSKPRGKLWWGKLQLSIPVIGKILRRVVLLRFAQAFSMVISSGIPLVEGIELVASTVGNAYATKEIYTLADSVRHGFTLSRAAAVTGLFTPLEIQMLSVSEETGELAAMLDHMAIYYQREVEYDIKRLNDILEPVMIVGLAIIILMLAFAVYLPIWNMVNLTNA